MSSEELPPRESMEFDVVIVGAGPSGLAAAIRLKQLNADLTVVVVEKGSEVGAHILSGAVIDPVSLDKLLPDWRADAAGDANLPAIHPAADRTREPGRTGDARQSLDANAAVDPRGHHENPRKMVRLRHRHPHHPRHGDVPSGVSVALAVLQADVVAGPARHREGAGADTVVILRSPRSGRLEGWPRDSWFETARSLSSGRASRGPVGASSP